MQVEVNLRDDVIEAYRDGKPWGSHPYNSPESRRIQMGHMVEMLLFFGVEEFTFRDARTPA